MKESSNFTFEDNLSVGVINADGVEDKGGTDINFSPFTFTDFVDDPLNIFDPHVPCDSCRRYFENVEYKLFDLGFETSDVLSEGFSFACKEFNGVSGSCIRG